MIVWLVPFAEIMRRDLVSINSQLETVSYQRKVLAQGNASTSATPMSFYNFVGVVLIVEKH